MNPIAGARSVHRVLAQTGLPLREAVVAGDDLAGSLKPLPDVRKMFNNEPFPDTAKVLPANAGCEILDQLLAINCSLHPQYLHIF